MREIFPGLIFFRVRKDNKGEPITAYNETMLMNTPLMDIWTCRAVKLDDPMLYYITGPGHIEGAKVEALTREQIGTIVYLGMDFVTIVNTFNLGSIGNTINELLEKAREDIGKILGSNDLYTGSTYPSSVRNKAIGGGTNDQ